MAETPQPGSQSQKRSVGDAKILGASKKAKLDETAFGASFNEALVHESVRAELAARRRGTHATKTRGNVRGGGAKPWRQKGTGRARAGSSRSPIWTGGGVTFGPSPRHYTFKVNRKERRAALRSALSVHAGRDSIAVFDPKPFDTPATKKAAALLEESGLSTPILVVLGDEQEQAALSFRNIALVSVLSVSMVGIADLIGARSVVCTQAALDALTARAKGERTADESAADQEAVA
jgi:large subunit ribosomal protein L4